MAGRIPTVPVQHTVVQLTGGYDLITPTLSLEGGVARDALNFEVSTVGGYTRIAGYERYDGHAAPSSAAVGYLTFQANVTASAGATLTGVTSGAAAVVLGNYGLTVLAYTAATGTFQVGETVNVSGSSIGVVGALGGGYVDNKSAALFLASAADYYRNLIGPVPGSGPVRGVAALNGVVYAWRNNAGNTALLMYKATTFGWTLVPYQNQITFSNANVNVLDNATLTQGAVTATIKRVVLQTGTLASGVNTGRLIITTPTGGNFASGAATVSGGGTLTLGGVQTAITCAPLVTGTAANGLPLGQMSIDVGSPAGGGLANKRIYGADGVNNLFEFDGSVYVPIKTGMTVDAPNLVKIHKNMVFASFGPSVQNSGVGLPYQWSPIVGANEIAMPEPVTAFIVLPGNQVTGALGIFSQNTSFILYGTGVVNFNLVPYNIGTGAYFNSAANMQDAYIFDSRGVAALTTTLNFGNFDSATLTANIRPYIQQRKSLVSESIINHEKNQYRVFFTDGSGLYCTIVNGKSLGAMPVQFPDPVLCAAENDVPTATEVSYFGSNSGYVFTLDSGTSFDGQPIPFTLGLVFNSLGDARVLKRFRKLALEVQGSGYAEFSVSHALAYGQSTVEQGSSYGYVSSFLAPIWDSLVWDAFVWDGSSLAPTECSLDGTAENIGIKLTGTGNFMVPFTINSATIHWSARRGLR